MSVTIKARIPFLKSRWFRIIVVLICAGGIVFSALWLIKTDREIIREIIKFGEIAVESKDIDILAPCISKDYVGYYGTDREDALSQARHDLKLVEEISIKIKNVEIEFKERGKADVTITFFVSGYYTGSDVYNRLYFRGITRSDATEAEEAFFEFTQEDDGKWRITEADINY